MHQFSCCLSCTQATPSADTAMFFFQTNHLHFSAEFLGRVRLVGSIASLAGVGTYNYLLKDVPLTKMFFWTAVLGTGLGLTQLILITGAASSSDLAALSSGLAASSSGLAAVSSGLAAFSSSVAAFSSGLAAPSSGLAASSSGLAASSSGLAAFSSGHAA